MGHENKDAGMCGALECRKEVVSFLHPKETSNLLHTFSSPEEKRDHRSN